MSDYEKLGDNSLSDIDKVMSWISVRGGVGLSDVDVMTMYNEIINLNAILDKSKINK